MRHDHWRRSWGALERHPFALALMLVTTVALLRFLGTQGEHPAPWLLPLGFAGMTALPWIWLRPEGRRAIGWTSAGSVRELAVAVLAGASAALLCGLLGEWLYGHSDDNWFRTVAVAYRHTVPTEGMPMIAVVLVFTLPACIFSPLGEEILFRGLVDELLATRWGTVRGTAFGCVAFGVIHLCHHGMQLTPRGLEFRGTSAAVWVGLMTATAALFALLRRRSGSLMPAIAAHAAFNATMNGYIFARLWSA